MGIICNTMDGNKTTKILHSLLDNMEELHTLWLAEEDETRRDNIYSALQSLEESEDKLKKAYFDQVTDNLK